MPSGPQPRSTAARAEDVSFHEPRTITCAIVCGHPGRAGGGRSMSEVTGGRAVVELLKAERVRYIFGIVGATFLDVLDALYDDRSVEYINVRHEQAGALMADGLARVTGLPGVCLVTSGPGATNLLTGVAAAYVAHSPVVALVGGVSLEHAGKDAFQDYDLVSMFRPVTKLAIQVTKPERIPEVLRDALRVAMSGRTRILSMSGRSVAPGRRRPQRRAVARTSCSYSARGSGTSPATSTTARSSRRRRSSRSTSRAATSGATIR